ncbi:arsenic transporter [Mucilaginibacter sp. 21P]|uniref:arsenic transporter n=1 Tax=Mucilaginibacter sp. 21P TaxID=2778902 RepID=UPI001C592C61|nr:arsenic transporter [Mucilaginibacter sp. 21P]QXV64160.1 arsenic transporter [Mucilaginibacter sp. 21P]
MNHYIIWAISIVAIAGVIIRPFKLPEAVWAVAGALILFITGLISFKTVTTGVGKGTDVYLFLSGMMLLSEAAREEKLFDWIASYTVRASRGSAERLFLLIFVAGTVVTALLSNDATAVVLTPAVIASCQAAGVKNNLPYLLICAFVANAASFLLPISNPANLVIYQKELPSLLTWLGHFLLPSIVVIVLTYVVLKRLQNKSLKETFESDLPQPVLSKTGKLALYGIILTIVVLLTCSALDIQLGWPTFITGLLCTVLISITSKKSMGVFLKQVSWGVLALVAGLFVIVEALTQTGVTHMLADAMFGNAAGHDKTASFLTGSGLAVACNLVNNLPAGLIAGEISQMSHISDLIRKAILIGIDLGPNLSVTGSLATILWLNALRRENINVTAMQFLKYGVFVMLIPLIAVLLLLPYISF